jgi:hypothetical protein
MSGTAVAASYAVGAAVLGLWVVVRFPGRGPRTISSAVLVAACAIGLLRLTGGVTRAAIEAAGPGIGLPCVFLPFLTLTFWSAAHVVRHAVEQLAPYRR